MSSKNRKRKTRAQSVAEEDAKVQDIPKSPPSDDHRREKESLPETPPVSDDTKEKPAKGSKKRKRGTDKIANEESKDSNESEKKTSQSVGKKNAPKVKPRRHKEAPEEREESSVTATAKDVIKRQRTELPVASGSTVSPSASVSSIFNAPSSSSSPVPPIHPEHAESKSSKSKKKKKKAKRKKTKSKEPDDEVAENASDLLSGSSDSATSSSSSSSTTSSSLLVPLEEPAPVTLSPESIKELLGLRTAFRRKVEELLKDLPNEGYQTILQRTLGQVSWTDEFKVPAECIALYESVRGVCRDLREADRTHPNPQQWELDSLPGSRAATQLDELCLELLCLASKIHHGHADTDDADASDPFGFSKTDRRSKGDRREGLSLGRIEHLTHHRHHFLPVEPSGAGGHRIFQFLLSGGAHSLDV